MIAPVATADLIGMLQDCRSRTLELVRDLDPGQLMGARLDVVNPLLWEIGHLAWFHEHFILRTLDERPPVMRSADALYDSAAVAHDRRWDLPLPTLEGTLDYMDRVQSALVARLNGPMATPEESYRYQLTTFHEDMHGEAFTYSRQTLGYPMPVFVAGPMQSVVTGPWPGDVQVPGGRFWLGSPDAARFVFDNEKWAHDASVAPFRIARAPVTNEEFAAFVDERGYGEQRFWNDEGWRWRTQAEAEHPLYWSRSGNGRWEVRRFDQVEALAPHQPVVHVNWHEANAWCRWAGRRLPSEAEWEVAAAVQPTSEGGLGQVKLTYPWGEDAPTRHRANLDGVHLGCVDVAANAAGDSPWGCRQMIGNVWEWTGSTFAAYPGFSADIYKEYSEPWFGTRKVLRGGAWATRARMISNTYRNFFTPERRDVFAGFRSVAL